ncbi:hypothetical protein LPJ81_006734, partial [Coemansia sp. IMI 209127]
MSNNVHRPTYIGIHARDASTRVLYVSSGCRQGTGYTPEFLINKSAHEFISDPYKDDYSTIYENKEEEAEDDANAYVMYGNIRTADGSPVLHRVTSFKCDNCVIFIMMVFPDIPYQHRDELEVQMLDGARKRMNVTREREADRRDDMNQQSAAARWRERSQTAYGQRVPLYYAPSTQIKVAFVLENPAATEIQSAEGARRLNGPLVVFVTGSVSRLIDADTADVMHYPFMRLVAPEDLLRVSKFFEKLAETHDVLFETFSL